MSQEESHADSGNRQFHNRKGVATTGRAIGCIWTIEARDECWREEDEGSAILMAAVCKYVSPNLVATPKQFNITHDK